MVNPDPLAGTSHHSPTPATEPANAGAGAGSIPMASTAESAMGWALAPNIKGNVHATSS